MPTIQLDRATVGPNETVTGQLMDNSLDFTAIPPHMAGAFRVVLTAVGGSSAALNFIIPNRRFVDSRTVTFEIPRVGPLSPAGDTVPEGSYHVNFAYGFWAAVGMPGLRVLASPTTAPSSLPGSYPLLTPLPVLARALNTVLLPFRYLFSLFVNSTLFNLITGRVTLQMLGVRQRGLQQQTTFFQVATTPPPAIGSDTSVRPLLDSENFPEWEKLIDEAERFVYVVFLGFDEKTNLRPTDQLDQGGRPESQWRSIELALKQRARRGGTRIEIKVLVWESTGLADWNEYADWFTDIGNLGVVELKWRDIRGADANDFISRMRAYSSASDDLLGRFHSSYRNAAPDEMLSFPTGIEIALENHPVRSVLGSHHQKFILTDKGAWIGGLNALRHQWDTLDHIYRDLRRAHSGEGVWPFTRLPAPGEVFPWHDTGALVKGSAIRRVFDTFSARWDNAVRQRGPYDALHGRISHRFSTIRTHLKSQAVIDTSRFKGRTVTFSTVTDGTYLVDSANVTVSLPAGAAWAGHRGVTEIKEHYERAIDAMEGMDSFVYIENQYFTDVSMARKLFDRWRRNVDMPGEREVYKPFAYILIPYEPQPTLDWTLTQGPGPHYVTNAEMRVLKWLELRSAREIWKRGSNGHWEPFCAVEMPQNNVRFRGATASDPSQLSESSQFEVNQAIVLNPNGTWKRDANGPVRMQPNPVLAVGDVMTKGDIMTYTLVTTREVTGASGAFHDIRPSVFSGEDIGDRLHLFLKQYQTYCHSKAATFINRQHGNWMATLGSANLNPRSLDDRRDYHDSEMNIWWSGQAQVEAFRSRLWTHHLRMGDPLAAHEQEWAQRGWNNMIHIMQARGSPLEGDVVRLDLVDRKKRI